MASDIWTWKVAEALLIKAADVLLQNNTQTWAAAETVLDRAAGIVNNTATLVGAEADADADADNKKAALIEQLKIQFMGVDYIKALPSPSYGGPSLWEMPNNYRTYTGANVLAGDAIFLPKFWWPTASGGTIADGEPA
jgi:hypothetical protein